jgi:hypothetical protein
MKQTILAIFGAEETSETYFLSKSIYIRDNETDTMTTLMVETKTVDNKNVPQFIKDTCDKENLYCSEYIIANHANVPEVKLSQLLASTDIYCEHAVEFVAI